MMMITANQARDIAIFKPFVSHPDEGKEYWSYADLKEVLDQELGIKLDERKFQVPVDADDTVYLCVSCYAFDEEWKNIPFQEMKDTPTSFYSVAVDLFKYDEDEAFAEYVMSIDEEDEPSTTIQQAFEQFKKLTKRYPMALEYFLTDEMGYHSTKTVI